MSILIGLLPTYQTIGIAAPIALLLLRILQGLAVGGEWAGATLMAMEHSGKEVKGLGASITSFRRAFWLYSRLWFWADFR
ncbi:hypothetical protein P4S64_13865 [Vibrio sp. M60_M31a]